MEESPCIAAKDAERVAAARCDDLQYCDYCVREEFAMGESPWIVAGDGKEIAVTKHDQHPCNTSCL